MGSSQLVEEKRKGESDKSGRGHIYSFGTSYIDFCPIGQFPTSY